MPHYFPNTIRAKLQGRVVRMAHLASFDFDALSGFEPAYLWNGSRAFVSGGHTWNGLRGLGQLDGLDEAVALQATTITATLSGVDSTLLNLAVSEERSHYVGRMLRVYLQFFDEDWQPLDNPFARAAGIMDGMEVARTQAADGATIRTISVTAPNIFSGRRVPPYGYFTDRDQQQRSPGDLGLQHIPELQNASIPVPWLAPHTGYDPGLG